MASRYLSTGQAADLCSVTPDTVLKWIRSGYLQAKRTAGGHNRIDRRDIERLLRQGRDPERRRHFRYCWEYNGNGHLLPGCQDCAVYLMRAHRCYEVAKLAPEAGHPKTFCKDSCEECEYYRRVHLQPTNVLVVTDDPELTSALKTEENLARFNMQIADCEYACSAAVHDFRPDFAIVDCSLGVQTSRDISHHLAQDPRAPSVKVILAGSEGEFPKECDKEVFARIERPFGIQDLNECVGGIEKESRDQPEQSG